MSDFDKEAEREASGEVRTRQERTGGDPADERPPAQGATMTNSHCGTCGDPLFQQNGTTFCPSCHGTPMPSREPTSRPSRPRRYRPTTVRPLAKTGQPRQPMPDPRPGTPRRRRRSMTRRRNPVDEILRPTDRIRPVARTRPVDRTDLEPSRATVPIHRLGRADRRRRDRRTIRDGSQRTRPPTPHHHGTSRVGRLPRRRPVAVPLSPQSTAISIPLVTRSSAHSKFADEAAATDDPRYARECLEATGGKRDAERAPLTPRRFRELSREPRLYVLARHHTLVFLAEQPVPIGRDDVVSEIRSRRGRYRSGPASL